jgi:DNA polymerase-3 subunit beta
VAEKGKRKKALKRIKRKENLMIITFPKEKFLEKLYPSMVAVSNKSTMSSTEGVLLETMPDGVLRITTYDLSKGVRSYIDGVKIDEEGSFIINANRLLQIVKVLPDNADVTIEVDNNLAVKVKSGKSSFSLFAMKGSDFPAMPDLSGQRGFTIASSVLKRMINKVIHSVAVQDNRPQLCGAFFTFEKDSLEVISCDSYTLSKCSMKCSLEDIGEKSALDKPLSIIVPGHALNELVRMLGDNDNPVKVYMGVKHAIFHIDGVLFFTRLIDGEYIDYNRIMPREQTIFLKLERERLLAGLERAILVAEEKYAGSGRSYVKLTVSGDSLILTSSSASGKIYDEMSCEHEGEDLEIGFNCRFLINSVRAAEGEYVFVTMKGANQSITIEPCEKEEDKDFFYMVLPVRMNEKA